MRHDDILPRYGRLAVFDLVMVLTVSQVGGIRPAARTLTVPQSVMSRRLRRLEDTLGVSLFERTTIGAHLTPAGWAFAERAREILRTFDAAVGEANARGIGAQGV